MFIVCIEDPHSDAAGEHRFDNEAHAAAFAWNALKEGMHVYLSQQEPDDE